MAQTVSNDALWEKLSEIEERIDRYLTEQKKIVHGQEQEDITAQLKTNKDQIAELFKKSLQGLGNHCDSHFEAMYGNIDQLEKGTEGVYKILMHMYRIMKNTEKHSKINVESKPDNSFLNFKLFKVRKTSISIAILGLMVFILTLFCMKQQNDYVILNNEYYRRSIVLRELQIETDSLKNMVKPVTGPKKKR